MPILLHLSDIHFGTDHYFPGSKGAVGDQDLTTILLNDLDSIGVHPDLIIISGDLTSKATRIEFDLARAFLTEIKEHFRLEITDFAICPGNHDVLWTLDDGVGSRGEYEAFAARFFGSIGAAMDFIELHFRMMLIDIRQND